MVEGLYVYCILELPADFEIDLLGVDKSHKPYIINCAEVGVLVSQISLLDFSQKELSKKSKNLEWLREKVGRHEEIIEKAMDWTTVIPISFGTIFKHQIKLREAVKQILPEIKKSLNKVKNHREWSLKLYCDFEELRSYIVDSNSQIQELKWRLDNVNEEQNCFLEKRLQEEVSKKTDQEAEELTDYIYNQLAEIASRAQMNELVDMQTGALSKPMLLNSVYLVDKSKASDFLLRLKKLRVFYFNLGFHFYHSGPWPPYSFSKLKL
ncbi:GvpL/GvpF family gas vesicle protein [Fuchsiella alkaliacetigena]|uniref:GvpL/GvpF family gas vesicle protein n=1 Tax=Fuchsiella alkaliacetigena TaxID=957042 RepID=UPI00200A32E9|nr:GvpL/GvpF family gas vesicle protein [Fuchsiella alkaliacetigena]MCK8824982.1 GvpL/GvpF family gas vesicle protein [Fuchsiella alkaliacetigena]